MNRSRCIALYGVLAVMAVVPVLAVAQEAAAEVREVIREPVLQVEGVSGAALAVPNPEGYRSGFGSGRYRRVVPAITTSQPDGLPADAQNAVRQFDQQAAAIRARAEAEINTHRQQVINQLQALQDQYTRAANLDAAVAIRDKIRALQRDAVPAAPQPDPGYVYELRRPENIGRSFLFVVTGTIDGAVWGSDIYTDDSDLSTAAVHAGVLRVGETAVLRVTLLAGQDSYSSSTRNGVTTHSWQHFGGSFRVERGGASPTAWPTTATRGPDAVYGMGALGQVFEFVITGSTNGYVWGTDTYTDDSSLAAAAVHAGILSSGQTGIVRVKIVEGRPSYYGSSRNGVVSHDYSTWGRSFVFLPGADTSPSPTAAPNPGSLMNYRDRAGQSFLFVVTGTVDTVFGTDIYTDDSSLAGAAVHAGILKPNETGVVKVTILPGQDSYRASTRNGITSLEWQHWGGSFRVERGSTPSAVDSSDSAATMNGKYRNLLRKLLVPNDVEVYGELRDWGHYTGTSYYDHSDLPAGYWVYVAPNWYIWGEVAEIASAPASEPRKQ